MNSPDQAAFFTGVRQRLPLEQAPNPLLERSDDGQLPGANSQRLQAVMP